MAVINVFEWMELTRYTRKGLSPDERVRLKQARELTFALAGTTPNAIAVAKSRGAIGRALYDSLRAASAHAGHPDLAITMHYDDHIKLAEKERMLKDAIKTVSQAARA